MTLAEIKTSDRDILSPADIASVLHMDPQEIRERARGAPETLGFRTVVSGKKAPHVKIPRLAFVAFMEGR